MTSSNADDVLAEFSRSVVMWDDLSPMSVIDHSAMADEIVRLRAQLTRMACPVCHEVNPAEVHTCTPAPKVTVLDEWRVVNKYGHDVGEVDPYGPERERVAIASWDRNWPQNAPHTVRRVALLDEPTTGGVDE